MIPLNSTSKHWPTDMGIIAGTKLLYNRCLLLFRRNSDLAVTESLQMKEDMNRMPAGTRLLADPHMLGIVRMIKLARSEIDDTAMAR